MDHENASWLRNCSIACTIALYAQAVLGAVPRHLYRGALEHIFGAFVVFTVIVLLASRVLARHAKVAQLLRPAASLLALVVLQFFLGFTTYVVRPDGPKAPGTSFFELTACVHQMVGALLIISSTILTTRAIQAAHLFRSVALTPEAAP